MIKNFEYRIYPTKRQVSVLNAQLAECQWLYNQFLEQRKTAWDEHQETLSLFGQHKVLTQMKKTRESLNNVHSQVLQNVAVRIDLAMKAFFRRVKSGDKAGYPRFKALHRYNSMTFPQAPAGCRIKDGKLNLFKVGKVKIKLHREMIGKVKTCTIKRSATNKWYAVFSIEVEPVRLPENNSAVGIDVGLETFAYLSTDKPIENPRFFKNEQKDLAKVSRRLSKETIGTPTRKFRRKAVARVHERIKWKRQNFCHQEARKIVNQFGLIFVEDLNVNRMMHDKCFAKKIGDAAWSMFFDLLSSKAEEAGYQTVKINPAYTSQSCSNCGHRQKMPLNIRIFDCPCCHIKLNRDYNASLNILRLGLESVGIESVEAPAFMHGE